MSEYDKSHGSPWDRGSADSWYNRGREPHWYPNGTGRPPQIAKSEMTPEQIEAYHAGYDWNEQYGGKKSYD